MSSSPKQTADEILGHSFLDVRAKLLEVAATLDRMDRAAESGQPLSPTASAQRQKLDEGMKICLSDSPDRAAQLQQLFSRQFDQSWRQEMSL